MNSNEILAAGIIDRYYTAVPELRHILWTHSRAVADYALQCLRLNHIEADLNFVEQAALLHDIGIIHTHAPSICCTGTADYICHGTIGAAMLRELSLPNHARVAERHTGAGLSRQDIITQGLPLPQVDLLPETIEEKVICYADKFFSKSGNLTRPKSLDKVRRQMASFGPETLSRFESLHSLFSLPKTTHIPNDPK